MVLRRRQKESRLPTEHHNTTPPTNKLVGKVCHSDAWRRDAMDEQNLVPLFRTEFIHSDATIGRIDISCAWQRIWWVGQLLYLFLGQMRQLRLDRRWNDSQRCRPQYT
jgi:hypothetical protein